MLPNRSTHVERLLTMKQVKDRIGFSLTHIDRLTDPEQTPADRLLPTPVRIGFRKFMVERELNDWIARQIATRDCS